MEILRGLNVANVTHFITLDAPIIECTRPLGVAWTTTSAHFGYVSRVIQYRAAENIHWTQVVNRSMKLIRLLVPHLKEPAWNHVLKDPILK